MPISPRNSTWFTRPFLLVRGWGLGTRLSAHMYHDGGGSGRVGDKRWDDVLFRSASTTKLKILHASVTKLVIQF